jgi:PKD repeat protein
MKIVKTLLILFLALIINQANAQCGAWMVYTVSGDTVTFYDSSYAQNSYTATWSFGDGTSATGTSVTHIYNTTTARYYTACLVIYDSTAGCRDSTCVSLVFNNTTGCNADFSFTRASDTVTFTNQSSGAPGATYNWYFGDGSTSTNTNPVHVYSASATTQSYWACLYVTDSTGNFCDSTCKYVTIPGTGGGTGRCYANMSYAVSGTTVYLRDSSYSANGHTATWYANGTSQTGSTATFTYNSTGSGYLTICLYIYDSVANCSDSTCVNIPFSGTTNCNPTFTYREDSANNRKIYFFGSNPPSGGTASWIINDGSVTYKTGQNMDYTFGSSITSAWVAYYLYDSAGNFCDSISQYITWGTGTGCQASYYVGLDTSTSYSIYIVNNSTGTTANTSYYWDFGDGDTSHQQTPTHSYSTFGLYNLCLTITDSNCTSTYCDSVGMDSLGRLLKVDGFSIRVVNESDLLGVEEINDLTLFNIYPNPSNGFVNLDFVSTGSLNAKIEVLNVYGEVVFVKDQQTYVGKNEISLDLMNNSAGLYFVNISAGNQRVTKKVLIRVD